MRTRFRGVSATKFFDEPAGGDMAASGNGIDLSRSNRDMEDIMNVTHVREPGLVASILLTTLNEPRRF